MPYYGFYDWTYFLVLIGAVISMIASSKVKSTYAKYGQVRSHSGMTATDAARRILDNAGLRHVRIERIAGDLTDHYSPKELVLRLSDTTINSTSIAAIGVAAHECGHAIQHAKHYAPLNIRNAIVPGISSERIEISCLQHSSIPSAHSPQLISSTYSLCLMISLNSSVFISLQPFSFLL